MNRISTNRSYLNVRMGNAEVYCADVMEWAKAVLGDAEKMEI